MVIALIIVSVLIVLALLGRTSIEKLKISTDNKTIDQTFNKGMNRVEYESQGKKVVANLFIPDDYKDSEKRPGVVIAPPATAVKEQASNVYAEKLSKLGYITLAFDPRGIGESEGTQADTNPYHFANDISSWVTYLSSLKQVDSNKIFNLGVCHGAVGAVYETFQDPRIKALGLVVPSINGPELTRGTSFIVRGILFVLGGIFNILNFFGLNIKSTAIPSEDKLESADQGVQEVGSYYPEGKPGYHPRWVNGISATGLSSIAKLYVFNYADKFNNIPVFMATGKKGYSYEPAMRFYNKLNSVGKFYDHPTKGRVSLKVR